MATVLVAAVACVLLIVLGGMGTGNEDRDLLMAAVGVIGVFVLALT